MLGRCFEITFAIIWIVLMTIIILGTLFSGPTVREQLLQYQLDHLDDTLERKAHDAFHQVNAPSGDHLLDHEERKLAVELLYQTSGLHTDELEKALKEVDKVNDDSNGNSALAGKKKDDKKLWDVARWKGAAKNAVVRLRAKYHLNMAIERERPICKMGPLHLKPINGNDGFTGTLNMIIMIIDLISWIIFIIKCPATMATTTGAIILFCSTFFCCTAGLLAFPVSNGSAWWIAMSISLIFSIGAAAFAPEIIFVCAVFAVGGALLFGALVFIRQYFGLAQAEKVAVVQKKNKKKSGGAKKIGQK